MANNPQFAIGKMPGLSGSHQNLSLELQRFICVDRSYEDKLADTRIIRDEIKEKIQE